MWRPCAWLLAALLTFAHVPRAADQPPNVLLITIDTLRADRVGRPGLTPSLDALAARGARFTRAYAHAPTTLASHASILTGLLPPSHGVRNNGAFRLDAGATTLAGLLRSSGYRTGAFVSAFVLAARFGLNQGFEVYDDRFTGRSGSSGSQAGSTGRSGSSGRKTSLPDLPDFLVNPFRFAERPAADTLAVAAAWIVSKPGPWFAWVHLFDPHAPYVCAQQRAAQPYDNEVACVDAALGRFFTGLGETMTRTIAIVTSDHGESLGDHGESTHGLFAYDATLRVPLIVAGPGVAPRTIGAAVSHVDVMPTTLALAVDGSVPVDGRSLVPLLKGDALPDRPIYFEALDAALTRGWAPLTGVVAGAWKYVELPIPELYRLDTDAEERRNQAVVEPARATELRNLTLRIRSASERSSATAALADAETRARLRSLGYLGGASWRLGAWRADDDPKRLLPLHTRFQAAADVAGLNPDAAITSLRALIADRPDFGAAYEAAATLLLETGRPRDAVALLADARAKGLRQRAIVERLGAALTAAGDPRAAVALLEPVVASEPDAVDIRHTLSLAYVAAGEHAKARDALTATLRLDPSAPGAWTNLGTLELQRGAMRDAQQAFERALELDDRSVPALKGLGAALESANPGRAAQAWARAIALAPRDYDLLARLGFLLATSDAARAKPLLERFIREAPDGKFAVEKQRARKLLSR